MGEKLLTAGIGIFIGVIIAAGLFFGPQLLAKVNPPLKDDPLSPISSPVPTPAQQQVNGPVLITSLTSGQIVNEKTVEVTGKTVQGIAVTITSSSDEQTVKADATGNFSTKIKIEDGENTIVAAITDDRGNLQTDTKQIILEITE